MSAKFLTQGDLDQILALQDKVYDHLQATSNPRFIIKRSNEYIASHLNGPHSIIGYDIGGQHIAQAIFRAPDPFDITELGVARIYDYDPSERISILQGIVIDPEFQGQGYMRTILQDWMEWTASQGIKHLAARTEANHEASKANFRKAGFEVVETIIDPFDNAKVCVHHRLTEE